MILRTRPFSIASTRAPGRPAVSVDVSLKSTLAVCAWAAPEKQMCRPAVPQKPKPCQLKSSPHVSQRAISGKESGRAGEAREGRGA